MALIQTVEVERSIIDQAQKMNARYVLLKQLWRGSLAALLLVFLALGVWSIIRDHYIVSGQLTNIDSEKSAQLGLATNGVPAASAEASPKPVAAAPSRIMVYSASRAGSDVLTSITSQDEFQVVGHKPGWQQIALTSGLPVWIELDSVERLAGGRVSVSADLSFAFSKPSNAESEIVGVIYRGDNLGEIRKQGSWVRVWSPPRFLAWVKEDDLLLSDSKSG